MFANELKNYVSKNPKLVNMKPAGPGIYVLKYKKKVFYDNLWNNYIAECRGSIVDADFNLVSYPFTKIYNYGIEKEAPVLAPDTKVTAFRKVNGFMVACAWHNDDILVSTTGSTDSDYVAMAKEMMLKHMSWSDWQLGFTRTDMQGMTVMFECVHPDDPHIIPEVPGMYVLGYRKNTWGSKVGHDKDTLWLLSKVFKCHVPEAVETTVGNLVEHTKNVRHEGFVFYTVDDVSAKIKSPYYLTSKWVARNPRTDKLVDLNKDIKLSLDEEYYPLVDAIRANIAEYTNLDEQSRLAWIRKFLEH